jgi:hypothetical protein
MRALAVLAALTACGDNLEGIAIDDYSEARRTAECERLTRCGLFATVDACEDFPLTTLGQDVLRAVDEKKIAYDGAAAKQCIAAMAAQSCDVTSENARTVPTACGRVFAGRVDDGDTCAFDLECASNACDAPACPIGECCSGTCLPTVDPDVDEACNRDTDCDGFCGADKKCHALLAEREMCTRDEECDFDLACIGATELQPGRCRDLLPIGGACPYMRCAEIGAMCSAGICVATGLAGATCATSSDCSPYGACNASGRCEDRPQLGQPCTTGCTRDAWCDTAAGLCAPLMPNTSPCGAGNQCESLYCEEGPLFDACADLPVCT